MCQGEFELLTSELWNRHPALTGVTTSLGFWSGCQCFTPVETGSLALDQHWSCKLVPVTWSMIKVCHPVAYHRWCLHDSWWLTMVSRPLFKLPIMFINHSVIDDISWLHAYGCLIMPMPQECSPCYTTKRHVRAQTLTHTRVFAYVFAFAYVPMYLCKYAYILIILFVAEQFALKWLCQKCIWEIGWRKHGSARTFFVKTTARGCMCVFPAADLADVSSYEDLCWNAFVRKKAQLRFTHCPLIIGHGHCPWVQFYMSEGNQWNSWK